MNIGELTQKILDDINSGELVILNTLLIEQERDKIEIGVDDETGESGFAPSFYSYLTLKLKVITKNNLKKIENNYENNQYFY